MLLPMRILYQGKKLLGSCQEGVRMHAHADACFLGRNARAWARLTHTHNRVETVECFMPLKYTMQTHLS